MDRRTFLAGASAITLVAFARPVFAQTTAGPFSLAPLPYAPSALEPHIDAKTMELHHGKHHATYVDALNAALKDHGEAAKLPLPDLLAKIGELPESIRTTVRNSGGGHANHTMFWQVMGPGDSSPEGELAAAIDRDLGGLAKLQEQFNAAGAKVFGSGWVFVTVAKDGKLAIVPKPNQDTPLMQGQSVLLGNDVWEHAYYLKHQNRRADYLKVWWNAVDWVAVGRRYAALKSGELQI